MITAALVSLAGCGDGWDTAVWQGALSAYCTVTVDGKGLKQVETDYLPHVVACENGSADTEALKAQAVAARSYLYYKLDRSSSKSICDSQSCQVYTCSRKPSTKHYDAVKATVGQVVRWGGVTVCTFYVAGAKPPTSSCIGTPGAVSTEKYVTYNWNKSGSGVTQSKLGWVSPTNKYNRGCMSQNGSHCLSTNSWNYKNILKFYYGMDIALTTTTGSCVNPPKPDTRPPPKPDTRPPPRLDRGVPPNPDRSLPGWGVATLHGGCSVGTPSTPKVWPIWLICGLVWALFRRRR